MYTNTRLFEAISPSPPTKNHNNALFFMAIYIYSEYDEVFQGIHSLDAK